MSPFFCFSLDTEPDNLWVSKPVNTFDHFSRLKGFHDELVARGCRPTYLTTSEVVEDEAARGVMEQILATGKAEVGAHFHTWTRQWQFDVPDLGNPPVPAMAHQLGQSVEEQMLAYTCEAIQQHLGVRPISFRGGRWSLNGDSITSFKNCGICVDSTFVPGRDWTDATHPLLDGPNFCDAIQHPHYLEEGSLSPNPDGPVLELPVGCSFLPNRSVALSTRFPVRVLRKLCNTLGLKMGYLWLRPTLMSRDEMQACMRSLRDHDVSVWMAMIHSSEIGENYYFQTEAEINAFMQRCYDLVSDAVGLGAKPATMKEVWEHFDAERINQICGADGGRALCGSDRRLPVG